MLGYRGAVVMNQQPLPRVQGDTRVGDYRLLAKIGEGGMGVVHLAQASDGSRVALKVLRPHIIGDDEARERLAREVASLRRVTSPRIAEVIDADPWGETPYVATRYVPGLSLHEHVRQEGPVTGDDLVHFATGLAEAIIAVHQVGVLHRDIKPSNVLLEGRSPVLIDFGLARLAEDPRLTQTGWLLGTPGYLAPEILYGDDATTASDMHSWAATVVVAKSPSSSSPRCSLGSPDGAGRQACGGTSRGRPSSAPSGCCGAAGCMYGARAGAIVGAIVGAGAVPAWVNGTVSDVVRVGASRGWGAARATGIVKSSRGPRRDASTAAVSGRSSGSGARHERTSGSRSTGTPDRSCSPRRTRSMIAIAGPVPNGGRPVAANTTVAAQECTSEAVVASSP